MLSCGKVIGQNLSKITRNISINYVKQTYKFTEIRGVNGVRFASDKGSKSSEPEKCTPEKLSKSSVNSGGCEIKNSQKPLPEMCEEICGKIPPSSNSSSDKTFTEKYLKHMIAALLITGATVYVLTQTDLLIDETSKSKKGKKKKEVDKDKQKEKIRYPVNSISIPPEVPYLLIGGGTAAFSAFRSIKSKDPKAKVLVITNEYVYPYMRPPLSKELWYNPDDKPNDLEFRQWNGTKRSIYYEPPEFYSTVENLMSSDKGGVAVATGWKVKKLDPFNKIATLEDGYEIKYDKCLLATGGSPKTLDIFKNVNDDINDKVLTFRTTDDYLELKKRLSNSNVNNIVIIGGGFLGSELACALARNLEKTKKKIYQVYKEKYIMSQILPQYLSQWTTKRSVIEGVIPVSNSEVKNFEYNNGQLKLLLNNGKTLPADQVIVAIGVHANTDLAEPSSLEVEPKIGGFLVNAELEARRDLWVAGDAACFYDVRLGRRRVEHHDHAVISGRLAGENMTGAGKPYLHQSMFWSDLGPDVGYEAIGIIDSTLPTVGIFAKIDEKNNESSKSSDNTQTESQAVIKPQLVSQNHENSNAESKESEDDYRKGIIFYLKNDTVVGIVLWNIFNRMSIARQVLKRETHVDELSEVAKLFSLHED